MEKRKLLIMLLLTAIIILIGIATVNYIKKDMTDRKKLAEQAYNEEVSYADVEEKKLGKGDISIYPEEIIKDFIETGLEKTKEKYLKIDLNMSGEVEKVKMDEFGSYYIDIKTGIDGVPVIRYYIKESLEEDIINLEEGYNVEMVGKVFSVSPFYIEILDSEYVIID